MHPDFVAVYPIRFSYATLPRARLPFPPTGFHHPEGLPAKMTRVRNKKKDDGGFFGIGIYQAKHFENVGVLWRGAYQLGAAFIFTVGKRYRPPATDVAMAWIHIPLYNYGSFDECGASLRYSCRLVGVEMGGEPLPGIELQGDIDRSEGHARHHDHHAEQAGPVGDQALLQPPPPLAPAGRRSGAAAAAGLALGRNGCRHPFRGGR